MEFKVRSSRVAFRCSSQLPSSSHPHGHGTSVTTDEPLINTSKMNAVQLSIHFYWALGKLLNHMWLKAKVFNDMPSEWKLSWKDYRIKKEKCIKLSFCLGVLERKRDDIIYDKGGEKIQWSRDHLFRKWCRENCTATCERMELLIEHYLMPHTKTNSKCIKHLNARPDTMNLLEESIGRTSVT